MDFKVAESDFERRIRLEAAGETVELLVGSTGPAGTIHMRRAGTDAVYAVRELLEAAVENFQASEEETEETPEIVEVDDTDDSDETDDTREDDAAGAEGKEGETGQDDGGEAS